MNATLTWRVSDVELPDAPVAVTVIDQRPVVSWSGALNVPSSATGSSIGVGADGGGALGVLVGGVPSGGPS